MADSSNGPELLWSLIGRAGRSFHRRVGFGTAAVIVALAAAIWYAATIPSQERLEAAPLSVTNAPTSDELGTRTSYLPDEVFRAKGRRWVWRIQNQAFDGRRVVLYEIRDETAVPTSVVYYSGGTSFPSSEGPVDAGGDKHGEWKRYGYVADRIVTSTSWWIHGVETDEATWKTRSE